MKTVLIVVMVLIFITGCKPTISFKGDPKEVCLPSTLKSLTVTAEEVVIECYENVS